MRLALLLVFGLVSQHVFSTDSTPPRIELAENDSFPIPHGIKDQLFYIQRTPNINTIMYSLNVDASGKLNEEEPVHVFWIRYADDSSHQELSFIQRNYAYGLKYTPITKDKYEMRFVSYKKYAFYLMRSATDRTFKVYAEIGDKLSILNRVFLKIEGGTFWFPHVVYVELRGTDPDTGKEVFTRFKP